MLMLTWMWLNTSLISRVTQHRKAAVLILSQLRKVHNQRHERMSDKPQCQAFIAMPGPVQVKVRGSKEKLIHAKLSLVQAASHSVITEIIR